MILLWSGASLCQPKAPQSVQPAAATAQVCDLCTMLAAGVSVIVENVSLLLSGLFHSPVSCNTMAKISRRQLCEPPTARFWKGCTPEFFGEMPSRRHPISLSSTLSIQSMHFVSLEIRVEGCPNDNGYKGYCCITQTASCLDCVCSDGYQLCSVLVSRLRQQPPQLEVPRVHHKKQSQYRKLHQQRSRGQTSTVQHFFKALKRGKGEQSETKILGSRMN